MNKSKYGKLSIIIILIATLFVSAAIAIFGLSANKGTGANSSAEISAPEIHATSTANVSSGTTYEQMQTAWVNAVRQASTASNPTVFTLQADWVAKSGSVNFGSGEGFSMSTGTSQYSLEVPEGKYITINLNGNSIIGNGEYRCITVEGGTLNITDTSASKGGQIRGGYNFGDGGAIFVSYGTLNLEGGTITGNGGRSAVYVNEGATFNMLDGSISNNPTIGVFVESKNTNFTMSGGTISNNTDNGVYLDPGSKFTMTDGEISGNNKTASVAERAHTPYAGLYGGGVYMSAEGFSCGFDDNTNLPNATWQDGATFTMTGGTIKQNTAKCGGGVYNAGTFKMYGGEIISNHGDNGGGVYSETDIYVKGAPRVVSNYHGAGYTTSDSIYFSTASSRIVCDGAFVGGQRGACLSVKNIDMVVTSGYAAANVNQSTGDVPPPNVWPNTYIQSDEHASASVLRIGDNGDEVGIFTNYASLWNALVNGTNTVSGRITGKSYTATLNLNSTLGDWVASSSTGFGTGDGFADGAIKVPSGKTITINLDDQNIVDVTGDRGGFRNTIVIEGTLTISGNGQISNGNGHAEGAIRVNGGTLNMEGGTITGNKGTNAVVLRASGTFNMSAGKIQDNNAIGVSVEENSQFNMSGTAEISNNVTGNVVVADNAKFNMAGGTASGSGNSGVQVNGDNAKFTMTGGTISGNRGGVYVNSGTFEMKSLTVDGITTTGTISGNTTTNGAGVNVRGGTFKLAGGIISGNTATENGGGVYVNGDTGTFEFTSGQIRSNTAKKGGGVYYNKGTFDFNGGTIGGGDDTTNYGNTASEFGGGVYIGASWTPTSGTISYNKVTAAAGSSMGGAGVCVGTGTFTLNNTNVDIHHNTTGNSYGGGVLVHGWYSKFVMSDGIIRNNIGNFGGGVAAISGGAIEMTGGTIGGSTDNANCGGGYGGGVFVQGSGVVELLGGTISYNHARAAGGVCVFSYENTNGLYISANINNNSATEGNGGGVYANSGIVNFAGGTVNSNSATGEGSGVYVNGATFNMISGEIASNTKDGVYVVAAGTFNLTSGSISGNTANGVNVSGTATMSGGTISENNEGVSVSGTFTMEDGTISDNTQDGVILLGGSLEMSGGTIKDNHSDGVYMEGGGTFEMTDGTISGNTEFAVSVYKGSTSNVVGEFTMTGGTISGNSNGVIIDSDCTFTMSGTALIDGNNGSGVYVNGGTFNMDGGAIGTVDGGNTSSTHGGGVYVSSGEFNMTAGEIVGNTATGNGGGVYVTTSGKITITGGAITDNNAANGAGIYVNGNEANPVSISNARIQNNTASTAGGGLYVYNGTPTVTLNTVSVNENKANGGNGGGIYISNNGNFTMTNCVVDGNTATGNGGGVSLASSSTAEIKGNNTAITGNSANNGGGIASSGCTLTVTGATVDNNTATGSNGNGGGIYVTGGKLILSNTTVSNGDAKNGAGLYVMGNSAEAEIENAVFTGNEATTDGGAIYVASGSVTVKSATVGGTSSLANTAKNGAGMFVADGTVDIQSGTISGNTASVKGGGVYLSGGSLAIGSVTVTGNVGGGIVVVGGTISMSGAPKIQNNFDSLNAKSNLVLPEDKKINLTGPFQTGTIVYVTSSKTITTDYTTHNSGTLPKVYFYSDDPAGAIVLKDGEAYFAGSLADIWNDAVERSSSESPVEFELTADWASENNSFGEGIGFQDGALYIPEGKSIILTSNGHKIAGHNENGYTIVVDGKLVIKKNADITIQALTDEEDEDEAYCEAVISVDSGTFEMNAGYIDSNDTGISVYGGTFIMNGGEITNSLYAGVYLLGTGSVTINDGQIYGGWYGAVAGGTKGGNFVLNGGQIYENTKTGVLIGSSFKGTAEIKDGSKIFDNGEHGVWVGSSASVTVSGGEIYNNKYGIYAYGGNATVTGGRIYGNTDNGIYIASNGTVTFSGGSITDNGMGVNLINGTFEMTGGEIYENDGSGVEADSVFKFSGGKIYNNGGYGVWLLDDDNEFTGGEIYGNVTGIYLDAPITVSGSLRVYDNFDKNGNPDNINVAEDGFVYVNGALTATAQLHVNFRGVVTTGFSNYNHGAAFDEIFLPDILGSDVTLNVSGEVVMTINYVSMWNKAVEKSLNEQTQVKFTLYSKWTSESNGNFGTTGDGFESGALKVPVGANILFDLNNFALTLNNTTSGGNTTVFKVYGTLEITDTSSRKTGGVTKSGTQTGIQAVNVAANGSFKLSAGGIGAFDAEYAIESAGTVYVAGGNIRNNAGGVSVNGDNAKFEMTGGNIYSNSSIGVTLDGGAEGLISGGSIYSNGSQGVYAKEDVTLTIEDGNIRNNTSRGVYIGKNCEVTMNGGNVYSNNLDGVQIANDSVFTLNGGKIYNNGSVGVRNPRGTFIMNGGEISGEQGVYVQRTIASFTMNGGSIYGTGSNNSLGVELSSSSFTMNGGSISNFAKAVFADYSTFNMEGGAIYGCGVGVDVMDGTFNMSAGEIYGCTTGVTIYNSTFNMSGGEITSNGTGVDATKADANFTVSGTAKVYDNTEYNVKLGSGVVITVDGTLTEAHIGVTVTSTTENFTSGYGLHNNSMAPATYFFSDDSSYSVVGVGSGTSLEAKLGTKVNQSAIVWRYTAVENGTTIESNVTIDGLYMGLDYEEGVVYHIEAISGSTGAAISFIVNGGETVTSLTVDGIGRYTLTVNNTASQYTNTLCTFEILRVTLDWEYRIEGEGANQWKTVDFDSFEYTGRTYQFRAMLDGEVVQQFIGVDDAACDAGEYVYTADETKYVNYELTITILTRKVEVVWNFNNATLGKDGVYYWTYDGFNHAPVASLKNIGGDLAGVINLNLSYSNGTALGAYAPIDAGDYTVTVNISDSYDGNIEISNTEATFRIRQLGLGVQWRDENGTVDSEFTFDYDGKSHELTAVLDGLLAGELSPVTVIYKQGETVVEAPVNAGTYTAYAQIVGESNYVLREAYSCQIVIEAGEIEVIFKGNEEAGGVYEWTFNGRGRTPAISVISKATGGEIANFTVEYAPADNTGSAIGEYTATTPINAGMYIARVTVSDTEGNVLIQSSKAFEIKQLEVTVTWSGVGGEEVDGVIRFEYDGTGHTVTPSVAVNVVDEYGFTVTSLEVVCTGNDALTDAGKATATASLKDTAYNKNFRIISGSTQKYEVYKQVITSYGWQDGFGGTFGADDTPDYSHGTITGELGPNLTVTVEGVTLEFGYTYSASFEGVWAADVVNGYTVTATLTEEYAKNYEFASGEISVELTFTITATAGNKVNVNVTWVIFTGEDEYVSLDEYLINNSIIYNGKVQYPTPVYINNGTYEVLSVNHNTVGADAGDYTATLLPSNLYNYVSGFECHYNIAPLGVTVVWQNSATDEGDDFEYVYNGKAQAPYAYATVDGKKIVATVDGNVNANTYVAVADFGNNYTVTNVDEAEKEYEIKQLEISADDVVWSFDKADGEDEDGVYFTFDGAAHAPEATVTYTDGDGKTVTVKMAVTGASEMAGTHTAYAVFDGGNEEHTNFTLVGTASTEYRIVSVESVEIIWEFEGAEGNENDGWYWIYNGEEHAPNAYLKAADGSKGEKLNVSTGNTEAGEYVAYVTSDMDFGGTLPCHAYAIKAKALNVEWSNTTAQYDGTAHNPTATVEEGIDGALELGVDYTVTQFTNAGKHTAEIIFLNNNYTFAEGTGSVEFVIEKITLKAELVWSVPEDSKATANENGVYSWQYDGAEHAPELTFKAAYMLGDEEVVFGEFTYAGLSALIGTHTVTATLGTATWKGEDVSENFALDTDIRTAPYAITHYVITIVWTADDKDGEEDGIPFWKFDTNAHGPTATYVDWNGDTLTIPYAKETNVNAKAYTATVTLPANCVLAEDSSLTAQYLIKQAEVSVIWEWTDAKGVDADGNPYWTYNGKTEYGPKAYIKKDDGTKGEPLPVHGQEINAGTYSAYVDANNGNYVITDGTDTRLYTINKMNVFVKWAGNSANENKFVWTYKENVSVAPTAQLIDADGNVILGSDKKPVKVTVTGAMTEVGTYTATAVDGFANYKIVEDATHSAQQSYEIAAASLKDKNFRWDGGDAKVDGTTYTYTYNGTAQSPVVRVTGGITVELTITDSEGNDVKAITDAGTYKITAKSMDKNYIVPDDMKEITVVIAKLKVEVVWSNETLVYNGSEQAPSAYFVNAQKTEVSLTVTVEGEHKNAGKGYVATANLTDNNYELIAKTATKKFDIEKKDISVSWTWGEEWTDKATDYDGEVHMPVATVATDDVAYTELQNITVYYTVTKNGKLLSGNNLKISDAGEYEITYKFEGSSAGNYMMSKGTETFTINRVTLTITLDDDTVNYGDPVPAYVYHITGFVNGETEQSLGLDAATVLNKWLRCKYNPTSIPGTYDIVVDEAYLADYLGNYTVEWEKATLTVNAPEKTLIWKWEGATSAEDIIYNGEDRKPTAYYKEDGTTHELAVTLYTKADYEANNLTSPVTEAINAGDYVAVATYEGGVYNFDLVKPFTVQARAITVVIHDQEKTYGEVEENHDALLAETVGWDYDGTLPVTGDELEIVLSLTNATLTGGLVNAGDYEVTGNWTANANYTVTFVGEKGGSTGLLKVEKAVIKVTEAENGANEVVQLAKGGNGKAINLYSNPLNYLTFTGETPQYKIEFSKLYAEGEEAPSPEDDTTFYTPSSSQRPSVYDTGKYVVNYRITEQGAGPNHEVKLGQWIIEAVNEDEVITVKFVKPYTLTYGEVIPEDLAKALIDSGSIEVTPSAAVFLENVVATAVDANGEPLSGKLSVGKYQIKFSVKNRAFSQIVVEGETENFGIIVNKAALAIEWGEVEFDYDETTHTPEISVSIGGEKVKLNLGTNTVNIGGEEVTLVVAVDGGAEIKEAGAYSVLVTVLGDNYEIAEADAHRAITVKSALLPPVGETPVTPDTPVVENKSGVPDWLLWVIIAALVVAFILIFILIIIVKRKPASDADGFYDDADMEND